MYTYHLPSIFFLLKTTVATFNMTVAEGFFVATPKSSNRRGIGSSPSPGALASASVLVPFSDITDTANGDASNSSPSIATLQKEINPIDGSITIHSIIPSGFAIVDHDVFDGKKIVATQPFRKGDVIYVGHALMLDLSSKDSKFELRVYAPEHDERNRLVGVFENSSTHSVDDHAPGSKLDAVSKRQVYGWDGFMNHSCSPNAYFPLLSRTPTEMSYQAIAIRDITTGGEITCDYALFDYECNGHEIEVCACGSSNCRGKMLGFRGLSLQDKVSILHMAEEEIREKFFSEDGVVLLQSAVPDGVQLVMEDGDNHLIASKRFNPGEKIFTNRATLLPRDDVLDEKKYVLEVDGIYTILVPEHHFIYRDTYAEAVGFDSYMDHSCEPNTAQNYVSLDEYESFATGTILPGEKITCDYTMLDNQCVGAGNMGTSSFQCCCGSKRCYGLLTC